MSEKIIIVVVHYFGVPKRFLTLTVDPISIVICNQHKISYKMVYHITNSLIFGILVNFLFFGV